MSEGSKTNGALAMRVAQIEADASALEGALKRARTINLIIFLAFILLVVWAVWRGYSMVSKVADTTWQQDIVAEFKKSYEQNEDEYKKVFEDLWDELAPELKTAFEEQLREDAPKFQAAILKERVSFQQNIQIKLKDALRNQWSAAIQRHEDILVQEFPAYKDQAKAERIINNFNRAIDQLIDKYYIDVIEVQLKELYAGYHQFPLADRRDEETGEAAYTTQLIGVLLELMKVKLISAPEPVVAVP